MPNPENALSSLDGVAHVAHLRGADADPDAPPDLLVEVPHGADRREHYDALHARMAGALPEDLHEFFHANTDMGAWDVGRRVAERIVAEDPGRSALLVRCLIPRTFVDTNRLVDAADELGAGGLTGGIPSYVTHPEDRVLLEGLHRAYVELAERAYEAVCGAGGFALMPHSYGPRTMGIAAVDAHIVQAIRAAWAPDVWATWPLRPEVDLITRRPDGERLAPASVVERVLAAYAEAGLEAVEATTYTLHPATQGARFAGRWPGQTLCVEVRRDLLVEEFDLLRALTPEPTRVERAAAPIAGAILEWLRAR